MRKRERGIREGERRRGRKRVIRDREEVIIRGKERECYREREIFGFCLFVYYVCNV